MILFVLDSRDGQEVKEKKIIRTEKEVREMGTKQYLDELVIPVLNKGLLEVNKSVRNFYVITFVIVRLFMIRSRKL